MKRLPVYTYMILVSMLSFALPGARTTIAQVTGISYSLSPSAGYVRYSDAAALTSGLSFGGEVGFGFGEYLEVSGLLHFAPGLATNWDDAPADFLRADLSGRDGHILGLRSVESRDVNTTRYGGRIRVHIGDFKYTPYVVAGTGVLRMTPRDLDAASVIYGELGAGVTFSALDRFAVSLGAQTLSYRLNPASTLLSTDEVTGLGLSASDFRQQRARNIGIAASVRVYLAGRSDGDLTDLDRALLSQFSGGNFRVAIEPVYGQIDFNSALGGAPGTRAVAGLSAGFDLGPYVGIRGFYWRDTKQTKLLDGGFPSGLGKAQYYGGEMQLRFNEQLTSGLIPYAVVGGGYFNDNGDAAYATDSTSFPSRYFALVGGGIELPLARGLRLHGAVRGIAMSAEDLSEVASPTSVHLSPMYTVGVNFNIGGSGRSLGRSIDERFAAERAEAELRQLSAEARQQEVEARQALLEREIERLAARLDSANTAGATSPVVATSTAGATSPVGATNTAGATNPARAAAGTHSDAKDGQPHTPTVPGLTTSPAAPSPDSPHSTAALPSHASDTTQPANYVSSETVTIPVPTVGEIYIRFGEVTTTASDYIAPPVVISTSGGTLDLINPESTALANVVTPDEIRRIVREEFAIVEAALRKTSGGTHELNTPTRTAILDRVVGPDTSDASGTPRDSVGVGTAGTDSVVTETTRLDSLRANSSRMTGVRVSLPPAASTRADTTRSDSMRVDSIRVDSIRVDSMRVDSIRVDSLSLNPLRIPDASVESSRADTSKAASRGAGPIAARRPATGPVR